MGVYALRLVMHRLPVSAKKLMNEDISWLIRSKKEKQ
jgi:hypothetical protein